MIQEVLSGYNYVNNEGGKEGVGILLSVTFH